MRSMVSFRFRVDRESEVDPLGADGESRSAEGDRGASWRTGGEAVLARAGAPSENRRTERDDKIGTGSGSGSGSGSGGGGGSGSGRGGGQSIAIASISMRAPFGNAET